METLIISGENRKKLLPVLELAKKLGVDVKVLKKTDLEDIEEARTLKRIELGRKTGIANKDAVLKKLGLL
ncbi:MAG: hypothetical protein NTU44_12575 [Bacteroidetes bacterium]|nr:hypothetical protein [Bacteroidota bacterium]